MTVQASETALKTVYDRDFLPWLEMTAELCRARDLENLDLGNLFKTFLSQWLFRPEDSLKPDYLPD